jgi:uncharacterized protein YxjI
LSVITDFLTKLQDQEIFVTIGIDVYNGKVFMFDDRHLVIQDSDGMSLLKIKEITAIDWSPALEIVAP